MMKKVEPTKFYYHKVSDWCHHCRFWIKSITLGSPDKEIWHCRFGFKPEHDSEGGSCIQSGYRIMRTITKNVEQLEIQF